MQNRIERVLANMPTDFEAALVTTEVNRFYLLGTSSSAGTLLLFKDASYFIIDFRYYEVACNTIKGVNVILQDNLKQQIADILKKHNAKKLNIEQTANIAFLQRIQAWLPDVGIDISAALTKAINEARVIKTQDEIDAIAAAHVFTTKGFEHMLNYLKAGQTEREAALELEFFMRKLGADGLAFDTILVSGPNGSKPHGEPGDRVMQQGDFVTMDYGAKLNGYMTDFTRTVAIGTPTDEMVQVYNLVLKAQLDAQSAVKAGAVCKEVDAIARNIIYGGGYEGRFGHGLGHALGIEVHEDPRFNEVDETVLRAGMVLSVEPGIYLPGKFGVRIEDIVAVTQTGCLNFAAASSKELYIL